MPRASRRAQQKPRKGAAKTIAASYRVRAAATTERGCGIFLETASPPLFTGQSGTYLPGRTREDAMLRTLLSSSVAIVGSYAAAVAVLSLVARWSIYGG